MASGCGFYLLCNLFIYQPKFGISIFAMYSLEHMGENVQE